MNGHSSSWNIWDIRASAGEKLGNWHVLEIAPASAHMTINREKQEKALHMFIRLHLVFWSFCAEHVVLFPFRYICMDQRIFCFNAYHKIMLVKWRTEVFLEFTSMKPRIYICITLKCSAAITWMSNLRDTREFIHRDLLVKGTDLLHL